MELLLLFVLFSLSEDPALKERFAAFLGFYRENRALFASLASPPATPDPPEKSDPPANSGGQVQDILEAYLTHLH